LKKADVGFAMVRMEHYLLQLDLVVFF
jgi:hypothetical protein